MSTVTIVTDDLTSRMLGLGGVSKQKLRQESEKRRELLQQLLAGTERTFSIKHIEEAATRLRAQPKTPETLRALVQVLQARREVELVNQRTDLPNWLAESILGSAYAKVMRANGEKVESVPACEPPKSRWHYQSL